MKLTLIIFVVVTAFVAFGSCAGDYFWTDGTLGPSDTLLHRANVYQRGYYSDIRHRNLKYPRNNRYMAREQITHIRVTDQSPNKVGGFVRVEEGGVGLNMVKLRFESNPGDGFDFLVEIFGHP